MTIPPRATAIMDLEARIDEKLLLTTKKRLALEKSERDEGVSAYAYTGDGAFPYKIQILACVNHETQLFQALANLHFALSEVDEALNAEI